MAPRSLKSLLPEGSKRRLRELTGAAELHRRVDALEAEVQRLETQLHESREELWERSRERWRAARPDADLTWGTELTGDAFIEKATAAGAFGPGKAVVEVGPGYGRLLRSAIDRGVEFASWTGIDLSEENVRHLEQSFDRDGVGFRVADVEEVELDQPVDAVLSSLTFKHLFPSFARALANLAGQMAPGAVLVIDLIEGERRFFEPDGVTYIRCYTRDEVRELVGNAGLESIEFDEVRHHPDLARMLVVARKPE
jgi:SAM-dependent methyltransferase